MGTQMTGTLKTPDIAQFINTGDEVDVRQLFATIYNSRGLVGFFVVAAVLAMSFYVMIATPQFEVDGLIQVEDVKGSALGATTKDIEGLFDIQSQGNTEISLMRSRMVLGPVVDELHLNISAEPDYFPVIGRALMRYSRTLGLTDMPGSHPMLARFAWNPADSVEVSRLELPADWTGGPLTLVAGAAGSFQVLDGDDNVIGSGRVGLDFVHRHAGGQITLHVDHISGAVGEHFRVSATSRGEAIENLAHSFDASETGKQSGILRLTLKSDDPRLAVRMLNSIAEHYIAQNIMHRGADAAQALKYLNEQLPVSRAKLEAAEDRLNDYRKRSAILDPSMEVVVMLEEVANVNTQLLQLKERRDAMLQRFTTDSPEISELDQQIKYMEAQKDAFSAKQAELPAAQQELLRLTREMGAARDAYLNMLNNAQQLLVVQGGTVGNARVVDLAESPLKPIWPEKRLLMTLSPMLGLVLGIVAAFVRVRLRPGVTDPRAIERITGLPVFATVPFSATQVRLANEVSKRGEGVGVLAIRDEQDTAVESLRSLRTTLRFADAEKNKTILLCGPSPEMGKSFLAVNLAAVLALAGERVLLIDADIRRGHIHKFFNRGRDMGLSEYLSGQNTLDECIWTTQVPSLDLLTTGGIRKNPSELLLSSRLGEMFGELEKRYDRVVVDCAPVMAVTDAAIIGNYTDITLIIARFEITRQTHIEESIKRLRHAGVNPSGFVLNCADKVVGGEYETYSYAYEYRSSS